MESVPRAACRCFYRPRVTLFPPLKSDTSFTYNASAIRRSARLLENITTLERIQPTYMTNIYVCIYIETRSSYPRRHDRLKDKAAISRAIYISHGNQPRGYKSPLKAAGIDRAII